MRRVFTNGCFDLMHIGHVSFLTRCRGMGDHLTVAVNTDKSVRRLKGADRPVNSLADRAAMLFALRCVDAVLSFDTEQDLLRHIERERPDILCKSGYNFHDITGADLVESWGGRVEILPVRAGVSTTDIIRKIRAKTPSEGT